MPVAIVVSESAIPAIFSEETDARLVRRLTTVKGAPPLNTAEEARLWLSTLPLPSGWFASAGHAAAFIRQCRDPAPMTGKELARIREALGLTREAFAEALGFGGNSNTRHKHIFEMEKGEKAILPERALRARALAAARSVSVAASAGATE